MSTELKPCPFCGSTEVDISFLYCRRRAYCMKCYAQGPISYESRESAIESWNRRRADGLRNFIDAEHKKAFGESKLQAAKAYFAVLTQFDKLLSRSMGIPAEKKPDAETE